MERSIAVVGLGPRGLYALECLTAELNRRAPAHRPTLTLFDDSGYPGSGPHYAHDQSPLNLLNIPCREVPLAERCASSGIIDLPAFPGYLDWQEEFQIVDELGYDVFPSRASVGQYLQARFDSCWQAWQATQDCALVSNTAVLIDSSSRSRFIVDSSGTRHGEFSHILLAIGHQPVEPDESIRQWIRHSDASKHCCLVEHPYPTDRFIRSKEFLQRRVAVRGMGLSMIDTVKALTQGRGGKFSLSHDKAMRYRYDPSGREPSQILPFSLDGLPMTPKPANASIDAAYTPEDRDMERLKSILSTYDNAKDGEQFRDTFIDGMADICAAVYVGLGERRLLRELLRQDVAIVIKRWLHDESICHPGLVSHDLATDTAMHLFLPMATEQAPISIDYCVGQVWRHCHKTIYEQLAFARFGTQFLVPFILLDQRMKRYAFGPPVDSVARLLALVDCGIVKFSISEDPVIRSKDEEWTLIDNGEKRAVDVMINTVQAPPDLSKVTSPLVVSLREDQVLVPVKESFGAITYPDGRVPMTVDPVRDSSIAFVGRLATGSIVEADALMECFGPALEHWAESVVMQ